MTKSYDYYDEEFDESPDEIYCRKKQEEEDQYYRELMGQTDRIELAELDVTDITEEELFLQILRDEREESVNQKSWDKVKR